MWHFYTLPVVKMPLGGEEAHRNEWMITVANHRTEWVVKYTDQHA